MEAKIADINRLFQKFKVAYDKNDLDTSVNLLSTLKVRLLLPLLKFLRGKMRKITSEV